MEFESVTIESKNIIASGVDVESVSVRRSGIAKVLWRKLNTNIPESKVILGGVEIYND